MTNTSTSTPTSTGVLTQTLTFTDTPESMGGWHCDITVEPNHIHSDCIR